MDAEFVVWDLQIRGCDDEELLNQLQQVTRKDRRCEVQVLMYLGEMDARGLFLGQGYSCLFRYVTGVLRMSEHQAYLRILVARLARRFPVVLEMLAEGWVNLSTLKVLNPHLTAENHTALLEQARNKTKAEVEQLVAELAPTSDGSDRAELSERDVAQTGMDELFASTTVAAPQASVAATMQSDAPAALAKLERPASMATLQAPRGSCRPLGRGRYQWQMSAGQSLNDKLKQLQHLLRHQVPSGDIAVITELAFDLLIEKTMKQRYAQVAKPRSSAKREGAKRVGPAAEGAPAKMVSIERGAQAAERSTRSRVIPNAVRRDVFARDGQQCTFVSLSGHRCEERGMLEIHHVHAFALGGESTLDNLKLVCRAHNQFFADQDFGPDFMRTKRAPQRPATIKPSCLHADA